MTRLINTLDVELGRFEYLPNILARNQAIRDFLSGHPIQSNSTMGLYLRELSEISQSLNIYLLNQDGRAVASNNFDKSYSFVGNDFSFQPYYKQALEMGSGRYFSLASNSGTRSYYFSAIVKNAKKQAIGVVVVQIVSIGQLEAEWEDDTAEFMISDQNGVIFMTSKRPWYMKTLRPLSQESRQQISADQRYKREPLPLLQDYSVDPLNKKFSSVWLDDKRYLLSKRPQQRYGWDIHLLSRWQPVTQAILFALALTALLLALTGLLLFLLWKNQQQRWRFEQEARTELESKVEERTRQLRHTQEELVQAAKMAALGQLSAAINHEINNPLSAIRTYADNAHQFLQRGQREMAESNLQEISSLTERMAAITRQLKTFSRKSRGQLACCDLNKSLDSALLIVQTKLSQTPVTLHQQRSPQARYVKADQVWLEQILVNLLSNALEATSELNDGQIWLSSERRSDNILINVADNGSGISAEDMPHIFEAFFTTKSIGKGLGLGLSISYRLARDMQGDLKVAAAKQGGAAFTLELCQDSLDKQTNNHSIGEP